MTSGITHLALLAREAKQIIVQDEHLFLAQAEHLLIDQEEEFILDRTNMSLVEKSNMFSIMKNFPLVQECILFDQQEDPLLEQGNYDAQYLF